MERKEAEIPREAMNKAYVVKCLKIDRVSYLLRMIQCGKKSCKRCPHGPYWYAAFRKDKKYREIYIGKIFMTLAEKNERRARQKELKAREQENG